MPNHAFPLSAPTPMPRPVAEASSVPATVQPPHTPLVPIVERHVAACRRNGSTLVVLCISLHGLDDVRQRHGHGVAGQVLQSALNRLRARLRGTDLAVQAGSDEFGAVLLNAAGLAAAVVSARVAAALAEPYGIGPLELAISVRTGAAVFPHAGSSGEALVVAALQARALKAAKG